MARGAPPVPGRHGRVGRGRRRPRRHASAAATQAPDASPNFVFRTVHNNRDNTFNQLLGINNAGTIAGYFGSGEKGHPNMGYVVRPQYAQGKLHQRELPGRGADAGGRNQQQRRHRRLLGRRQGRQPRLLRPQGPVAEEHHLPTNDNAKPKVDQLLAINDHDQAVGFYSDAMGTNHGWSYDIAKRQFKTVNVPGDTNVTAAGSTTSTTSPASPTTAAVPPRASSCALTTSSTG